MPKASVGQTGFNTGEVSPLCYGVTDNPRYKKGLAVALNYIPTLQGPIIRRPALKYAAGVKDSAHPPVLIPFKFSQTQNYMLEFGNGYIRFFTNNGEVLTSGSSFQLSGTINFFNYNSVFFIFFATRANTTPGPTEAILNQVSIPNGTILELQSPYQSADLAGIRYEQQGDTIYLNHPNYPTYKLQRQGSTTWKLSVVYFIDGPYLPANSYATEADMANVVLAALSTSIPTTDIMVQSPATISATANDGTGRIKITTSAAHGFSNGQNIFISGIVGTTEANNYSTYSGRTVSSTQPASWVISVVDSTHFILLGSTFTNAWVSGGSAYYAPFATSALIASLSGIPQDIGRSIALQVSGVRYWGNIEAVYDAATVQVVVGGTAPGNFNAFSTSNAVQWFLSPWFGQNNNSQPSCAAFHQSRLWFGGPPPYPLRVDSSNSGLPEVFSPSPPTGTAALTVVDSNSCGFTLSSSDQSPLRWMASTAQGLLAASMSSEWAMTPSGTSEALTPTNFNALQTSFFGSAPVAPVKIGNAVLYLQNALRKVREMTFFL